MANPRSPVKQSGDVHLPELESDAGLDDAMDEGAATTGTTATAPASAAPATVSAPAPAGALAGLPPPARVARARRVGRIVPMPQQRSAGPMHATFEAARVQVRARPWAA
ncbi:MAG TPA: hypothetical protein VEB23_06175, partial [Ramlibacter sp.]|nr:hypothetical protein [Ramlibacter sp.]